MFSQNYQEFYQTSLSTNKTGMYVLGGWAVGNIITGGIGWSNNSGEKMYFNQMNLFWNTVNLSIAGIGLYNNTNPDFLSLTNSELLKEHIKTENIYLINAGLDVLYMGAGFYMQKIAENKKRTDLLNGYGKSVIIQGGFLFVFDLFMYGVQRNHRMNFMENINLSADHISMTIKF